MHFEYIKNRNAINSDKTRGVAARPDKFIAAISWAYNAFPSSLWDGGL